MNPKDEAERDAILARLAQTREELRELLEPRPHTEGPAEGRTGGRGGEFPRSRTLRLLLSGQGVSSLGALVGGLLLARPGLVWRVLRALPRSALARALVVRAVRSLGARRAGKASG